MKQKLKVKKKPSDETVEPLQLIIHLTPNTWDHLTEEELVRWFVEAVVRAQQHPIYGYMEHNHKLQSIDVVGHDVDIEGISNMEYHGKLNRLRKAVNQIHDILNKM